MKHENPGRVRPTLEQVARRAGVSRATVSRVVNGSPAVAAHLQDLVRRAVEELGYVPNQAARSLVTQRAESLALVVSERAGRVFSDDPYFSGVIRGVGQELEAADRQLVLLTAASQQSTARIERFAAAGHVDGVMIFSMHGEDPLPERLSRLGVPVVCNGRSLIPTAVPSVDVANEAGARTAVRHLIDRGHRRIATIAGPPDMSAALDRLAGYRTEIRAAGRDPVVATGDFTRESGAAAMAELLALDPAVDAVFVASDLMAAGALPVLHRAGRRVPDDVAMIGFDDTLVARSTDPPLTTVHQPIEEIGRTMARQLLRLAAGERIEPAVVLPTRLVVRDSA